MRLRLIKAADSKVSVLIPKVPNGIGMTEESNEDSICSIFQWPEESESVTD